MRCRVFKQPDGSLLVNHPNPQNQLEGESDAAFYKRSMARLFEAKPEMAGLPFVDLDEADLPDRRAHCENADCPAPDHVMRTMWRISGKRVVIDHDAPNLPAIMERIEAQRKRLILAWDGGDVDEHQRELLRCDALLAQAQAAWRGDFSVETFRAGWERYLKAQRGPENSSRPMPRK